MQSNSAVIALLLIATITGPTYGRIVQVPYVSSDDTLYLKLDELYSADAVFNVFGNLDRIYQKEVFEIVEGKEVDFPSCYEQAPEANFWAYSELAIGTQFVKRDSIIYDFEQIKYPRNLIDIETYQNKIYFVKEDGVITIATISLDLRTITVNKKITTQIPKLAEGNLIILPNTTDGSKKGFGILITSKQAIVFDLEGESFIFISNLNSMTGYESAIAVEGKFIAGAFGQQGAKIFSIDFALKQLKLQAHLNSTNLKQKSVNIQDLAYDSKRNIIFILDHHVGVIPLQLIINDGSLQTRLTSSVIKDSFCNVIYYDSFNDELYLNCRELHKYRINNWPLFTQKVLPRQEISIRQITSNKDIVALVGRNIFELIAMERKVAVYDDRLLDKLILQDKFFVSGNENYLLVGTYEVTPPSVTCLPTSSESIGRHKVLFKVTAECDAEYFKAIQFSPGAVSGDDKCVYSIYRNVKIWKGKSIEVKIFIYITLLIAGLGVAVLIYWGASYFNFRKLKNQLRNYESLEDGRFGQASSTEQKQPGSTTNQKPTLHQKASDNEGRHELNEDIDVPADVHDIE